MHKKPAFAALVSAIAVAMLTLTGCQEDSTPQAQPTPRLVWSRCRRNPMP